MQNALLAARTGGTIALRSLNLPDSHCAMPASRRGRTPAAGQAREVRAPLQERSQQSLERMLDAAEALIYERGFDELTVGDLVQRSRTSVGSFYARFED